MNKLTRIFFFGNPDIAVPSLTALAHNPDIEVVGVGVFPDRPQGRKQVLTPSPVKSTAQALNLPVHEIASKTDLEDIFAKIEFDLGIVIAFGQIFPESVLSTPPLGVINVHFSLLPAYRGASPVQSAILNGDTDSGITWQRMVKALDAGDILYQVPFALKKKTTATCWDEMATLTADHFSKFIHKYTNDDLLPQPQDESQATHCGKFTRSDGAINPATDTAETIFQKYRAFDPWPGIYWEHDLGRLKILQCAPAPTDHSVALTCAQNTHLQIETLQLAGKKPQPATTFNF